MTVSASLDDQARDLFFAHCVIGHLQTYSYLQQFYTKLCAPSFLSTTVDAVSLAYFGHVMQSKAALLKGRQKYVLALRLTHTALESPQRATEDTTLLAVLLLDNFEKAANNSQLTADSWSSHVNGALTLVQMRGRKQFRNPTGLLILIRFMTNLQISCVARGAPVPGSLRALRTYAEQFVDVVNPKWQLTSLMVHFSDLRALIFEGKRSSTEIFVMCLDLDEKLQSLSGSMPLAWRYNTAYLDESSKRVYADSYNVYPDQHVTQTWNVIRLVRVMINVIIRKTCPKDSNCQSVRHAIPELSSAVGAASDTINSLALDICASVPQYTGAFPPNRQIDPLQPLRCYTLLFPLFVAGQALSNGSPLRRWIVKELRYMGDKFGIRNAEVVAKLLEHREEIDPWEVYALLGSYAFVA